MIFFSLNDQARQRIMRIIEKVISKRRKGLGVEHDDFLQRLLMIDGKPCNATNTKLTDSEIKDNILTMIIAGQHNFILTKLFFFQNFKNKLIS